MSTIEILALIGTVILFISIVENDAVGAIVGSTCFLSAQMWLLNNK
jgi:hypothetical protein